jgi:hypothetical protein
MIQAQCYVSRFIYRVLRRTTSPLGTYLHHVKITYLLYILV